LSESPAVAQAEVDDAAALVAGELPQMALLVTW
jgi:hypothetical protein